MNELKWNERPKVESTFLHIDKFYLFRINEIEVFIS